MRLPGPFARLQIGSALLGLFALLLPLLAAAAAPLPAAAPADDASELVLGRVSDNPKVDYAKLQPLLDYVVPRLADVGIVRGRVLMARDNQQMISYLKRGKVDWVTETSGSAMVYQERAGARLLLRAERNGLASYQSVIFARRDSGIGSLADLRGRSLALQSTASTSAYFLPVSDVLAAGLPLVILASPADRPSADVVGFVLARSELNISTWVHKGLADAGAFSEQDWQNLERMPKPFRNDLVVVHRTGFVPRALELVAPSVDAAVEAKLRVVLLAAADDPEARAALKNYYGTTAFAPLDDAARAALGTLRAGVARIRLEVE